MRKIWILLFVTLSLLLSVQLPGGQKKISPKELPPKYRIWLEEEIVYIITTNGTQIAIHRQNSPLMLPIVYYY